jgi:hypothetical protein
MCRPILAAGRQVGKTPFERPKTVPARAVKKMQKKRISSLTPERSDDYIPLTNEGGTAAGGNLLRSHGIHREPL